MEKRAMSVPTTVEAPRRRRTFLGFWLPLSLLALYGLGAVVIWNLPDPPVDRAIRTSALEALTLLFIVLLALWFLAFSGVRWWLRLSVLALLVALPCGSIDGISHFSGNMVPIFHFRWQQSRDAALEAWRREHAPVPTTLAVDVTGALPTDYPGYRGRERDGIAHGPALSREWKTPPQQLWRHPCGGGYASVAIAGKDAFTIEQRGDKETVVCYDTDTGLERWEYSYDAKFYEAMGGEGPRATPTIADGGVYSLGATGHLVCLEATSGKERWRTDILEKDNKNVMWGMSGSPLVYDRFVVVNPGVQTEGAKGGALAAYDRKTGDKIWSSGDTHAGYSSPMLATLAGKRQIVLFDRTGIAGYDPEKGTRLWSLDWETPQNPEIKVAQPLVLPGDRVFIASSYGNGCAMLKVAADADGNLTATKLWESKNAMRCRFTSPVADNRYLYGLDEGVLVCLDPETGERKWRGVRYNHGQLLRTDDLLVIQAEDGDLALVEATGDAFRELGRFHALAGHTWNCPALADGKAYVRNDQEIACYDLRAAK
jgi:outer membrane protein assembly factor BamB